MNEEIRNKIEEGLKPKNNDDRHHAMKLECLKLAYESIYKLDAGNPIEWARKTSLEKKEVVEGLFALADKNWEWVSKK